MPYDHKDSRNSAFCGWTNGRLSDLYSLNVSKVLDLLYDNTEILPSLGQLFSNVPVIIKGVEFKDAISKVYFSSC